MDSDPPQEAGPRQEEEPSSGRRRAALRARFASPRIRWATTASAVFASAACALFFALLHSVLFSDAGAPTLITEFTEAHSIEGGWETMSLNDLRFVVSVLSRNARVLVESPGQLFDLPQCYPTANALALGEPIIASSLIGVPAHFLFSEPASVFNFALIASTLIAAAAMYWLVRDWTNSPPAAITAGLLYAFHVIRMRDPVHFYVWDNAWTLLALVFARRLFTAPRWRDACALGVCVAMQIAGSVYPLVVALIVAAPMAAWFARVYGMKQLRWGPIGLVLATGALAAWGALGPFFELQSAGHFHDRSLDQVYIPFAWLMPGDRFFPGTVLIVLCLIGVALPRGADVAKLQRDPRLILAGVMLVLFAFATGGLEGERMLVRFAGGDPPETWVPNLWSLLARIVPALDVVRAPGALLSGVHALACVLAGLGVAALLNRCPTRWRALAIVGLIALAWIDTIRPASLGYTNLQVYETIDLRPPDDVLDFFGELEAMGNEGPLYELIYSRRLNRRRTEPLLAAAYHGRATSVCYNSFVSRPASSARERLPHPSALRELRALGFTTLIVHDPYLHPKGRQIARTLDEMSKRNPEGTIRELASIDSMTAYAITARPRPTHPDASPGTHPAPQGAK